MEVFILLLIAVFFGTMVSVRSVKNRGTDLSDSRLAFNAGCWPSLVFGIGFLLMIGGMGGDPSAGLGQLFALIVAPGVFALAFFAGWIGGLVGLRGPRK